MAVRNLKKRKEMCAQECRQDNNKENSKIKMEERKDGKRKRSNGGGSMTLQAEKIKIKEGREKME